MTNYNLIDDPPEINGEPFFPVIFEKPYGNSKKFLEIPSSYNTVRILLDGRADALLNWKEARHCAIQAISQRMKILWEIDLGLFSRLYAPLCDQPQFLTLGLSLDHFRDSLWTEFKQHTVGLCIFRGSANFEEEFLWDDQQDHRLQLWMQNQYKEISRLPSELEIDAKAFGMITMPLLKKSPLGTHLLKLFCRDVATDYLSLLARRLPAGIWPVVFLNTNTINEELLLTQLITREKIDGIGRFVTEGILPSHAIVNSNQGSNNIKVGVCLPQAIYHMKLSEGQHLQNALRALQEKKVSFRIIHETLLTTEWDGLDYLIVLTPHITSEGLRRLKGFCAAGGTVVSLEGTLELSQEITFTSFQEGN